MTTTTDDGKLDNMTVRRFAKLLKSSDTNTSTPITTGKVVKNGNSLYVAIDDDTLVPISDTNSNVSVGDIVTLALDDNKALIVGNITDTNATTSEVKQTNVKVAKAQATAEGAEKVATNYIDIDENKGITVGNMQEDTLGHNTYIDANGVSIRDGETVLASFEDDEIALGKNSQTAVISLCGNSGEIKNYEEGGLFISANTSQEQNGSTIFLEPSMFVNEDSKIRTNIQISSNYVRLASVEEGDTINRWGDVSVSPTEVKISASDVNGFVSRLKVDNEGCFIAHSGEYTKVYGETVLYSSASGTTSTVTLSESAANFTYLEIYYNYSNSNSATSPQFSTKVYSPNSKYVALEGMFRVNSATMQFLQETIQIKGTQILRTNTKGWWQNSNTTKSTITTGAQNSLQFYIQRVVGIK